MPGFQLQHFTVIVPVLAGLGYMLMQEHMSTTITVLLLCMAFTAMAMFFMYDEANAGNGDDGSKTEHDSKLDAKLFEIFKAEPLASTFQRLDSLLIPLNFNEAEDPQQTAMSGSQGALTIAVLQYLREEKLRNPVHCVANAMEICKLGAMQQIVHHLASGASLEPKVALACVAFLNDIAVMKPARNAVFVNTTGSRASGDVPVDGAAGGAVATGLKQPDSCLMRVILDEYIAWFRRLLLQLQSVLRVDSGVTRSAVVKSVAASAPSSSASTTAMPGARNAINIGADGKESSIQKDYAIISERVTEVDEDGNDIISPAEEKSSVPPLKVERDVLRFEDDARYAIVVDQLVNCVAKALMTLGLLVDECEDAKTYAVDRKLVVLVLSCIQTATTLCSTNPVQSIVSPSNTTTTTATTTATTPDSSAATSTSTSTSSSSWKSKDFSRLSRPTRVKHSALLTKWSCWCLFNLSLEHPPAKAVVFHAGSSTGAGGGGGGAVADSLCGIPVVIDALKQHPANANVHRQGLALLLCLIAPPDEYSMFSQAKARQMMMANNMVHLIEENKVAFKAEKDINNTSMAILNILVQDWSI